MSDTARIVPSLTRDLAAFLADLAEFNDQHPVFVCPCGDRAEHDRRRLALMARKAELLVRCRADGERP